MEIFGYVVGIIYITVCIILGVAMYWVSYEDEGKSKAFAMALGCTILGPFVLALLIFFDKNISSAKNVIKNGMDIFKIEKHLINEDAYFLTGSGDKLLISGEFRKEVGLIANKYVKKELDNRRGVW